MEKKAPHIKLYTNLLFLIMGTNLVTCIASAFFIKDLFLVIQNLISFSYYLVLQIVWLKKKTWNRFFSITFLIVIELLVQVTVSAFYLGWDAGFQNFCFITFTVSFLNIYEQDLKTNKLHYKLIHFFSIFFYILISLRVHFEEPIKILPAEQLEIIRQVNGLIIFFIAIYLSTIFSTSYKQSVRKLKRDANIDELTQLFNRHAIRDKFDDAKRNLLEQKVNFGICILDIDDFKIINDSYGHNIGDEVLIRIAQVLKTIESDSISVCRWGGEEFLIIDQYGKYKENFVSRINILRTSIQELVFSYPERNIEFSITVTAGCSFSESNLAIHELIDQADNRLYWGKRNGKNKTIFSDN